MEGAISSLNTGPQLAETIVTDRNSRKDTQNIVNQKWLPGFKKYFSSFIKRESMTYCL